MTKFDKFLRNSLSGRNNYDWRLGGSIYPRKFRYTLESGIEADNTLQQAERDLIAVRARMLELALPLHREAFAAPQGPRRSQWRRPRKHRHRRSAGQNRRPPRHP